MVTPIKALAMPIALLIIATNLIKMKRLVHFDIVSVKPAVACSGQTA
jgi:hypothetical protein